MAKMIGYQPFVVEDVLQEVSFTTDHTFELPSTIYSRIPFLSRARYTFSLYKSYLNVPMLYQGLNIVLATLVLVYLSTRM